MGTINANQVPGTKICLGQGIFLEYGLSASTKSHFLTLQVSTGRADLDAAKSYFEQGEGVKALRLYESALRQVTLLQTLHSTGQNKTDPQCVVNHAFVR